MPQGKPVSSFFPPSLLYKKSLPCLVSLKAGLALTPGLPARAWPGFSSPPQPPFASCWLRKGKEKSPGAALGKLGRGSSRGTRQAWSGAARSCGEGRERNRGRGGRVLDKNQEKEQQEQRVLFLQRVRHTRAAVASAAALLIPRDSARVTENAAATNAPNGKGGRRGKSLSEEPIGQGCPFCPTFLLSQPAPRGGSERAWTFSLLTQ